MYLWEEDRLEGLDGIYTNFTDNVALHDHVPLVLVVVSTYLTCRCALTRHLHALIGKGSIDGVLVELDLSFEPV